MFFLFSKLFVYLLYPFSWIILLLLLRYIFKSKVIRKRLFVAAIVVFILFSNRPLIDFYASQWDVSPAVLQGSKPYSCAIVLGGFVSTDKYDNGYFNESADRFIKGLELYHSHKANTLLLSGGNGSLTPGKFRESKWAREQLLSCGVPPTAILTEENSRNTLENALFSKRILDSCHIPGPYLLVTSAFHMKRAQWVFNKVGMDVIACPCNYIAGRNQASLSEFMPQIHVLVLWSVYIKELVGWETYRIKMHFSRK